MTEKLRLRADWGAKAPRPMTSQAPPHEGFVHWTENVAPPRMSSGQVADAMRSIQAFHMGPERGWSDIGYHAVVFPSAIAGWQIVQGRPLDRVPAAQLGHNTGTAAVAVYMGPGQTVAPHARYLVETAFRVLRAPIRTLGWHGQVTATACPGPGLIAAVPLMARALGVPVYRPAR